MIELTDEQASVLKQGQPVRKFVPELGGDVVVILAAQRESTELVLQETLDEIRENSPLQVPAKSSFLNDSFVASLPEPQRPTGEHRESPSSPASPAHDSSSAPDGAQPLTEADLIALANRTNIPRVLRKIANRHIAQHYPTTVAAGLELRLDVRGNTEVWMLPLVYASPGYGDHGIVGDVGSIAIDSRTGSVVEVTARDEVVALVRKLHEENREAIEAAFLCSAAK